MELSSTSSHGMTAVHPSLDPPAVESCRESVNIEAIRAAECGCVRFPLVVQLPLAVVGSQSQTSCPKEHQLPETCEITAWQLVGESCEGREEDASAVGMLPVRSLEGDVASCRLRW